MLIRSIEQMSRYELLRLIREYDEYVKCFLEESEGYPVCLEEFYNNDYQYILLVGDKVRFDNADFLDADLHKWLMENKSINFKVVEVDNRGGLFWVESDKGIRCPYAISLNDNYRRVELQCDICKICMTTEDNDDIEYFVKVDENFDEKLEQLRELAKNYETYQDLEDFIYDNFILVDVGRENIEY